MKRCCVSAGKKQASPACSSNLFVSTVTVIDTAGAPVPDATLTAVLARTGDTLSPTSLALHVSGTYIVVDDGSRGRIDPSGDTLLVRLERSGSAGLTQAYFYDVPGGCHVNRVSGPDTLTLP